MLDKETYTEIERNIDAIVADGGNVQVRVNAEVVKALNTRLMFCDTDTVDRTFAWCAFSHDLNLDMVEKFLSDFHYHSFSNEVHAFFMSLTECREDIYGHLEDYEYIRRMSESDYVYSLVAGDTLRMTRSENFQDFLEYCKVYSLPKSYEKFAEDLSIVSGK